MKLHRLRPMRLQTQIILTLIAVIVPVFTIVTILQNQFAEPLLQNEIRQIGVLTAKTLVSEIEDRRLLQKNSGEKDIEGHIQELMYSQPNIINIEVIAYSKTRPETLVSIASSAEVDPTEALPLLTLKPESSAKLEKDSNGQKIWTVVEPIKNKNEIRGYVEVTVSTRLVNRILQAIWNLTFPGAIISIALLVFGLGYFLRRAIERDQKLHKTETENILLAERLHETERRLMNTEKLAVMGQLTASFAHEIGTPLAALSGHLQLLRDEISDKAQERASIIESQANKIAQIVRDFLQSTAKPASQRQLIDVTKIADQVIALVRPRTDAARISIQCDYDRSLGPIRVVPLELEQMILNLVNNSIDSLIEKSKSEPLSRLELRVTISKTTQDSEQFIKVEVYDTGEGIKKTELPQIMKPFYTTKKPGEGTGLGLSIIQDLLRPYRGKIVIDSKKGAWTRAQLVLPYS